jgi:hypothetical protein
MAEKYFFEDKNAKKAASKARTTARQAAENRKGAMTPAEKAKLKKDLSKGGNLDKAPARSKAGASTVAAVAKRFGVTAREARDIATAVGTAVQSARNPNVLGTKAKAGSPTRPTAGNVLKKQIKETITAAKTGKKGTTSPKLSDTGKKSTLDSGRTMPVFKYQEGKKRK